MSHSPGPWKFEEDNQGLSHDPGWGIIGATGHDVGVHVSRMTSRVIEAACDFEETGRSNARLVAEAPSMFALLEGLIRIEDSDQALISNQGQGMDGYTMLANFHICVKDAREILARAKGKS